MIEIEIVSLRSPSRREMRGAALAALFLRHVERGEHSSRERRESRVDADEHRRRLVSARGLDRDARPETREGIRSARCRDASARATRAGGDCAEELEPVGGGDALASAGHVKTPLFQQRHERGEHLEGRLVDILDDDPPPVFHRLRQSAGLPRELTGRRADDVRPEQRLGVGLRVQV